MRRSYIIPWLLFIVLSLCGCSNDAKAENYEVYCTLGEACQIVSGEELSLTTEGHLVVSLIKTQGPTEFEVSILCRMPEKEDYTFETSFSVSPGRGHSVTLPAGAQFGVNATPVSGQNGYATFLVAIS